MAVKSKAFSSVHTSATGIRGKKTSQGRGNVGYSTMNKNKKAKYCDYLCANHYHNSKRVKRVKG